MSNTAPLLTAMLPQWCRGQRRAAVVKATPLHLDGEPVPAHPFSFSFSFSFPFPLPFSLPFPHPTARACPWPREAGPPTCSQLVPLVYTRYTDWAPPSKMSSMLHSGTNEGGVTAQGASLVPSVTTSLP